MGNLEATLKHISRKNLALVDSKIGIVILALWHLRKKQLTKETIQIIKENLTATEFKQLESSQEYIPVWITKIILEHKYTTNIMAKSFFFITQGKDQNFKNTFS